MGGLSPFEIRGLIIAPRLCSAPFLMATNLSGFFVSDPEEEVLDIDALETV
jgi:hypothetical protein